MVPPADARSLDASEGSMVIIVNSRGSSILNRVARPGKAEQQVTGAGEDAPQPAPQIDLFIGRTAANHV